MGCTVVVGGVSGLLAWSELTEPGRGRRLRRVADAALAEYGLAGASARVLSTSFNTLYRVGDRVLRVGPGLRIHADGQAEAEARFLAELAQAGVEVPGIERTLDGRAGVAVDVESVPGTRECVLLTWTPGAMMTAPITASDARDLGTLSARLHAASAAVRIRPTGVLDGRAVLLFEIRDRIGQLRPRFAGLFDDALGRATAAIERLWGSGGEARVVHGDLTPANVVRARGGLVPIDFQDLFWGTTQQDIAHTLFSVLRDDGDGSRRASFREGYSAVRPWPDFADVDLVDLFIARRLEMVNLALALDRPGLDEYLERHAAAIRQHLAGVLRPA